MLKKINAIAALAILVCVLIHATMATYSMLTNWYNYVLMKTTSQITLYAFLVHALCGIITLLRSGGHGLVPYPGMNRKTLLQRIAAVLMLVLIYPHTITFSFMATEQIPSPGMRLLLVVISLVWFASMFTHVSVSFSKAFVTLGLVSEERTVERLDRAAAIVCACGMAVCSAALIRFFVML